MPETTPTDPVFTPATDDLLLPGGVIVPASQIRFQTSRSSGPGGQNVNKVNTRVELWVPIAAIVGLSDAARMRLRQIAGRRLTGEAEIHLVCGQTRSQESNRREVIQRLSRMIQAAAVDPTPRKKTRPSRASRARRLEAKRRRGQAKTRRSGRLDW
jgi:ribosome-associated protein